MRLRVVLVTVLVLTLVVVAAGAVWWWQARRTTYERALDTLPRITQRVTYTDWTAVREQVGDLPLPEFLDAAYDEDVSRLSALESNAIVLDELYGIDLRAAGWEAYGQSSEGAVAVLDVADATSYGGLRDRLRSLGYDQPASDTRAWSASEELLADIEPTLTPVLQSLVILEDEGLLILSDTPAYAERTAGVAQGGDDSLLDEVGDLAAQAEDPVAALLWAGDYACEDLTMSSADPVDQDQARALVDQAGGVSPLDGLLMARSPSGGVRVAFQFENDDQASRDLQPRTDLATGEAPGLGGSFADRFEVTSARADGRLVLLDLEPAADERGLISAISAGPVLFATC